MLVFKEQELLSKQEFADAIEVSYNTVTGLVDRGIIKPVAVNEKRQFFAQEQVKKYWQGEYVPVKKR